MNIRFSTTFDRQFATRLTNRQKAQALDAIELFIDQPFHKELRNHALKGEWKDYRSISVGGDLRLHYKELSESEVLFIAIGNHKQLYR